MLPEKIVLISVMCVFTALLEVSDSRPHIRHQKEGTHCSRCGPGWGTVSRCVRGRDTHCSKCSPGTYNPHHNSQPCWICSRCGPGLYEARPCTSKTDTVCDSCHRQAPDNPDYKKKCNGRHFFLAPEDAQSTGEQSLLVNELEGQSQMNDRENILQEDVRAYKQMHTSEEEFSSIVESSKQSTSVK